MRFRRSVLPYASVGAVMDALDLFIVMHSHVSILSCVCAGVVSRRGVGMQLSSCPPLPASY
jgi:hypothetical protein